VKLIGDANQHGFNADVGQHLVEVPVSEAGLVQRRHAIAEVVRDITNGGELDIASLSHRVEVGDLRDGPAPENAEAQEA
jgi:hypothetical protein